MERVRGPAREFIITEKQLTFAKKVAEYPSDKLNESVLKRLTKESGFAASSIRKLKKKEKIFELADYIRKGIPYRINPAEKFIPSSIGKKFTYNQEIFAQEIAADPFRNVKIAAERAGYPNPTYGYELITMPRVIERIKEIQEERKIKFQPSIDNILQRLFIEANSNMADYVKEFDGEEVIFRSSDDIPRDQMGCIQEIKKIVKGAGQDIQKTMALKLKDSHRAQALLFKYFGLGIEGTNADPREFVQDVVNFSNKVNQVKAFPMASLPGQINEEPEETSEESKQKEFQDAIIKPILPEMEKETTRVQTNDL